VGDSYYGEPIAMMVVRDISRMLHCWLLLLVIQEEAGRVDIRWL